MARSKNSGPIDFGKLGQPARAGRPFDAKVLLRIAAGSHWPANAQACTILPPFCWIGVSSRYGPRPSAPSLRRIRRSAAASKSSPGSISPLGMVQAPSSLWRKKGPPGCASSTCSPASALRYIKSPALLRGMYFDRRGVTQMRAAKSSRASGSLAGRSATRANVWRPRVSHRRGPAEHADFSANGSACAHQPNRSADRAATSRHAFCNTPQRRRQ